MRILFFELWWVTKKKSFSYMENVFFIFTKFAFCLEKYLHKNDNFIHHTKTHLFSTKWGEFNNVFSEFYLSITKKSYFPYIHHFIPYFDNDHIFWSKVNFTKIKSISHLQTCPFSSYSLKLFYIYQIQLLLKNGEFL